MKYFRLVHDNVQKFKYNMTIGHDNGDNFVIDDGGNEGNDDDDDDDDVSNMSVVMMMSLFEVCWIT